MHGRARGGDGPGGARSVRQGRRDAGGIAATRVWEDAGVQGGAGAAAGGRVSLQLVLHRKRDLRFPEHREEPEVRAECDRADGGGRDRRDLGDSGSTTADSVSPGEGEGGERGTRGPRRSAGQGDLGAAGNRSRSGGPSGGRGEVAVPGDFPAAYVVAVRE